MDIRYAACPDLTFDRNNWGVGRVLSCGEWQEPNLVLVLGTSHMSAQSQEDARRLIQVHAWQLFPQCCHSLRGHRSKPCG